MKDIFETDAWKNRWVHPQTGQLVVMDPAILKFFWEELILFDKHLGDLSQYSDKLEDELQAARARIADPINSAVMFEATRKKFLENMISDINGKLEKFESVSQQIQQVEPQTYSQFVSESQPFINYLRRNLTTWQGFLNEVDEKLPQYGKFIVNLSSNIIKRLKESRIFTFNNGLLASESVRNEIYRRSFAKDDSWLLGWDLTFRIRNHVKNDQQLEFLKSIYDSQPSLQEAAAKHYLDISFLGNKTKFRADVFYEQHIPSEPLAEESRSFLRVVDRYFNNRLENIFKN